MTPFIRQICSISINISLIDFNRSILKLVVISTVIHVWSIWASILLERPNWYVRTTGIPIPVLQSVYYVPFLCELLLNYVHMNVRH